MLKYLFALVIVLSVLISCKDTTSASVEPVKVEPANTTYYLIRHAEKERVDPLDSNPSLSVEGKARADYWARYFDSIQLDAIYSTNYIRTLMTARPVSEKKNLDVRIYDANSLYDKEFQNNTKNKKVLIVGHSNTTPDFVNKILGVPKYKNMDDNDNSSLYVVEMRNKYNVVDLRVVDVE